MGIFLIKVAKERYEPLMEHRFSLLLKRFTGDRGVTFFYYIMALIIILLAIVRLIIFYFEP